MPESSSSKKAPVPRTEPGDPDNTGIDIPEQLPILPLRDTVVFPGTVMPLSVGRPASLKMLDDSLPNSQVIGIVAQRQSDVEQPGAEDIYHVGVAGIVLKVFHHNEGGVTLMVNAVRRVRLDALTQTKPYLVADVETLEDVLRRSKRLTAAFKHLRHTALELIEISPNVQEQAENVVNSLVDPGQLADFIAANLDVEVEQRQNLLEELNIEKRLGETQLLLTRQLEIARLQQKIHTDVQSTITDAQRKAYLREELKAIQKELGGDEDPTAAQISELRDRLARADPPPPVLAEAERELRRLEAIHPASPEYHVILTYLETITELPWHVSSEDHQDLKHAKDILDRDHFDLEQVKRRLIEYLAVRKLNPDRRGPILCLVGPPGVGKTSLGKSIADALGRKFVRMSLGGIRDEAEVRGHRRTYIGAMPGRIIQDLRRAGTNNPVMMLDELDKLGADFRGDPASALLEVLDPRQNDAFVDRYLDVPFDLSRVIFIATANYMDPVPPALRDRMEVINIPGYTDRDKLEIARRYIVRRQMRENGLKAKHCGFTAAGLRKVINDYTREAGVRELERQIGAVCRGIAAKVAQRKVRKRVSVTADVVRDLLGPERYTREIAQRLREAGVVIGLAYTPHGGDILYIEATRYAGKGKLQLTGQIGDVMRESAQAALSLVQTRAEALGIGAEAFAEADLHVHVPAGAVPKDGPSAGAAIYTAIASLMLDRRAKASVAMTGEITLRGLVMPVGGIKEKSLAAARAGIRTMILPKANEKDLEEISDEVRRKLEFVPVETVDEVLDAALRSR